MRDSLHDVFPVNCVHGHIHPKKVRFSMKLSAPQRLHEHLVTHFASPPSASLLSGSPRTPGVLARAGDGLGLSRRQALALLAGASALPWAAQAASQTNAVRIAMPLEPNSLDTTTSAAAANAQVAHYNILQGLTRIEQDGQVTPCLASHWEHSPDRLQWRFTLRDRLRFHDGQVCDAHCVVASFTRAQQPGSGNKARLQLFANIEHLSAPDARTVVLHLKRPDAHLLFRLGESTAVVLHPQTWHQAATHPIGTGPYQFLRWVPGKEIRLQRTSNYWGELPPIEHVVFRFIPETQDQVRAFVRQEVDLFFSFISEEFNRFRDSTHYQVLMGSSSGKGLLAFNHRLPLLRDVRVRRAITHAIDRESFIQKVLQGQGTVIGSHFAPSEPGYIRLSSTHPYDPERARSLLRAAGVTQPVSLKLSLPPTPYARQGGAELTQNLAQVGIELEIEQLTWQQWLAGPFAGKFELTLINHVEPLDYAIYGDPDYYFGYDNAEFRALLHQHATARSAREEQLLLVQLQRFLAQDAANVWIFNGAVGTVLHKGLQGAWVNYPIFAHDVASMRWEA
jgi:peptide/nickel transport system substrate-binding protein